MLSPVDPIYEGTEKAVKPFETEISCIFHIHTEAISQLMCVMTIPNIRPPGRCCVSATENGPLSAFITMTEH